MHLFGHTEAHVLHVISVFYPKLYAVNCLCRTGCASQADANTIDIIKRPDDTRWTSGDHQQPMLPVSKPPLLLSASSIGHLMSYLLITI